MIPGSYMEKLVISGVTIILNDENIGNQVLPGLRYGDYTEINLGFKKDFGVWQIHAGADCRIGDIDGWGAGLAAKWQF